MSAHALSHWVRNEVLGEVVKAKLVKPGLRRLGNRVLEKVAALFVAPLVDEFIAPVVRTATALCLISGLGIAVWLCARNGKV